MLVRGCLRDQPPVNNLGAETLMASLVDSIFYVVLQLPAGGGQSVLGAPPGGVGLALGFLWTSLPNQVFSIPGFDLYLFTVIHHGCENNSLKNHQSQGWFWVLPLPRHDGVNFAICLPDSFVS